MRGIQVQQIAAAIVLSTVSRIGQTPAANPAGTPAPARDGPVWVDPVRDEPAGMHDATIEFYRSAFAELLH